MTLDTKIALAVAVVAALLALAGSGKSPLVRGFLLSGSGFLALVSFVILLS